LTRFWLPDVVNQDSADNSAGLVMGFGGADETAIVDAIKALAKAWR